MPYTICSLGNYINHDGDLKTYRSRPEGFYLLHPDEIAILIAALLALALLADRLGWLK